MSSLKERLRRHLKPGSGTGGEANTEHSDTAEKAADAEASITEEAGLQGDPVSFDAESQIGGGAVTSADVGARADPEGWSKLGASLQPGEWGDFVLRRIHLQPEHQHGHYSLSELAERAKALGRLLETREKTSKRRSGGSTGSKAGKVTASQDLLKLEADKETVGYVPITAAPTTELERLLFIDTETTGLGQGAGNVPFMIGIGYYEAGRFTIEQMLIRHPGEEASMLAYLKEKIEQHPILISYNGKSFDWPIVKNRYIMNRIPLPAEPDGHIDFLYPSRSLWKNSLASCRLGQIEEDRLGVFRDEDVPGSMAPVLYFRYLAEREPDILAGVFRHNEWDVLTLAGLAIHFTRLLSGEADWTEVQAFGSEEWYRFGLWLDKIGMTEAAVYTMEALADDCTAYHLSDESETKRVSPHAVPLARFFKKKKRYDKACELWLQYVSAKGSERTASTEPFVELSMFYEHHEKDWKTALSYAHQALDVLWRQQSLRRLTKEEQRKTALFGGTRSLDRTISEKERKAQEQKAAAEEELKKRIERLRSKLGKDGSSRMPSAGEGEQLHFPLEGHA